MNKACRSFPLFWTLPFSTTHGIPFTPGHNWLVPYFWTIVARRKSPTGSSTRPKIAWSFCSQSASDTSRAIRVQEREHLLYLREESSHRWLHVASNASQCLEGAIKYDGCHDMGYHDIGCHEKFKFCVVLEKEKRQTEFDVWASIWCKVCIQVCISPSFLLPYQ